MIYLPPMIKLEYLKKIRVRWIILAILLISVWIVMGNPRLGEWYSALRARSRHEKIISLHVVFESRHT